ncbi:MAG: polysaccharide lyase family 8 super-sandwich domain-containing protein [Bacteroidales bacterium]
MKKYGFFLFVCMICLQISAATDLAGDSVFQIFSRRVIKDLRTDKGMHPDTLDKSVTSILELSDSIGAFPDIDYKTNVRTNWAPLRHLDRMLLSALAYTSPESKYCGSAVLKDQIDVMLAYWHSVQPHSRNWYQNEIGEPQRMGQFLLLMQCQGKEKLPADLIVKSIERMNLKGGNPGKQAGANRVDVALHWMYRACLTQNSDLLKTAMDYIYSTVVYTKGAEGIQPDHSFTQHGRQLHIGAYGDVFIGGTTKACSYAAGTPFAIPEEKLNILVSLVKDTYLATIRGEFISYNVIGRASTRPGATRKSGQTSIMNRMMLLDPANHKIYEEAVARISGEQSPAYGIQSASNHYFRSDYTLHKRPGYTVDLRMVSIRTARNEYLRDNGEGIKQYFMSDGSTGIFVKGNEYDNIFPVWDYTKVPGVTNPQVPFVPQARTYIKMGQTPFAGGVTDSLYSVSAYRYTDQDTLYGINTSGNKAWFFFDEEVVCLGNGIRSDSDYPVHTTLNQCLLTDEVFVSRKGKQKQLLKGDYIFENSPEWICHNGVGYFILNGRNVNLSLRTRQGKWTDINTNYSDEVIQKDIFMLSLDHGIKPQDGSYAYILVPGINIREARNYKPDNISVLSNNDSVQVVYHKKEQIYGMVFSKALTYRTKEFHLTVDSPCLVLLKKAGTSQPEIHVADPLNQSSPVSLLIQTKKMKTAQRFVYHNESLGEGRSVRFMPRL